MKTVTTVVGAFFVLTTTWASAELKSTAPAQVCGFLKEVGLPTGAWARPQHYDTFGCLRNMKTVGSAPLPNNLAYYAEGAKAKVRQVKLVLNINARVSSGAAHGELLRAAKMLCLKATGASLPRAIAAAITSGRKASAKVGAASVEVIREDWPTGRSYEVRVLVE